MKLRTLIILLFIAILAKAEVKLPAMFTDNMILQQESNPSIWGWAEAKSEVTVITSWNKKSYSTKADKNGKWKLNVETEKYGGPYVITISDGSELVINNVLIGEVWVCGGQSNMEMPMKGFTGQYVEGSNMDILKSKNPNIRLIDVPRKAVSSPVEDFDGMWQEATPATVANFSATGYYFGRLINEMVDVPVGLISVNFGGSAIQAWMSPKTTTSFEGRELPKTDEEIIPNHRNRTPSTLYHGMLYPVIGYGIKGAIFYQGETNYQEPFIYEELFSTMVKEWRSLWEIGEFPFYYCQIAPFDYSQWKGNGAWLAKYNSAYLREAQRKAEKAIPSSGMAVLMDADSPYNIHPPKKKDAGERLALLALSKTYGMTGFAAASPEFNAIQIVGSTVTVSFNNVSNGITTYDQDVTEFEIAGANQVFYPATVLVRSKSVVLSAPEVKEPVAVRYAFKDISKAQIFSTEGLPLSSFRTDDW